VLDPLLLVYAGLAAPVRADRLLRHQHGHDPGTGVGRIGRSRPWVRAVVGPIAGAEGAAYGSAGLRWRRRQGWCRPGSVAADLWWSPNVRRPTRHRAWGSVLPWGRSSRRCRPCSGGSARCRRRCAGLRCRWAMSRLRGAGPCWADVGGRALWVGIGCGRSQTFAGPSPAPAGWTCAGADPRGCRSTRVSIRAAAGPWCAGVRFFAGWVLPMCWSALVLAFAAALAAPAHAVLAQAAGWCWPGSRRPWCPPGVHRSTHGRACGGDPRDCPEMRGDGVFGREGRRGPVG
jgi:hypothetical protein